MSAQNWPLIASWIKQSEGGFVDNPRDPGGATNYGITLRTLSAWRKMPCTVDDIGALTWGDAREIVKTLYWDTVHGDELPAGLDYCVADAAVNSGPVQAIKWLQRSLGIVADGRFGPVTAQAVKSIRDPKAAIERYDAARLGFMRHLRTWPVFGRGWFARVNLVTERAKGLTA